VLVIRPWSIIDEIHDPPTAFDLNHVEKICDLLGRVDHEGDFDVCDGSDPVELRKVN